MQYRDPFREYLALKADLAAIGFLVALAKHSWREQKFNSSQPRVPRGYENGGQWTDGADWGEPSDDDEDHRDQQPEPQSGPLGDASQAQTNHPEHIRVSEGHTPVGPKIIITGNRPGIGHNGPPEELPPEIPKEPPQSHGTKLRLARSIAHWIGRASLLTRMSLIGLTLAVAIEGTTWFFEKYYPYIESYFDPRKSLKELQDAVQNPRRGTDVHHIVEQTPGRRSGFSEEQLNSPENLVRIPTLRHWRITAYYNKRDKALGMTPRKYLEGKTWKEQYDFGLKIMDKVGIYNGN